MCFTLRFWCSTHSGEYNCSLKTNYWSEGIFIAVLIPSSLCLGICMWQGMGGCGKDNIWKAQNILLGDSAMKRNPDSCFVLASVSVTGPLNSAWESRSQWIILEMLSLYKNKLHGPSYVLLSSMSHAMITIALPLNCTRMPCK